MEGLPISEQLSTPSVVTQIIAGTNITIDQPNGNVTVNSSGGGGGEVFQATYYKSAVQNLTNGSTDITFDQEGSWNNENGYITHTGGTADFTVVQAGLYQLEFNTTVQANGATWTTTTSKFISIDLTRSPTAEQAVIGQSALIPSPTNYAQSICSTYNLAAGDVINCRIVNAFTGGPPQAVGLQNTIDLNTWFTWRYVASGGATPAGGVVSLQGIDGAILLASPGDTIGITVDGQNINIESLGVVSVAAGTGVSVDTASGVATVNNDGVLSISDGTNAPSVGAIVLSGSGGVSIEDTAGTFAITNTGVTSLTGGDGIGVDTSTGSVTVSNLGLLSASADPGIGVSTTSGVLTISNRGVRTLADLSGAVVLTPGTGIGIAANTTTNAITISNTGISSLTPGTAIGITGSTITNNGVQTFFDLSGAITVSATGATISKAGQNIDWTVNFPSPPVSSVKGKTGTVGVVSGAGIDVSGGAINADPITIINMGVRTLADLSGVVLLSAGTGISVTPNTGTNTITVASTVLGIVTSGTVDQTGFTEETTGPATGQYFKAVTVTGMEANGIVVATTSGTPSVCSSAWITTVIPTTNTLTFWVAANPVASGETWQAHYVVTSYGTAP